MDGWEGDHQPQDPHALVAHALGEAQTGDEVRESRVGYVRYSTTRRARMYKDIIYHGIANRLLFHRITFINLNNSARSTVTLLQHPSTSNAIVLTRGP